MADLAHSQVTAGHDSGTRRDFLILTAGALADRIDRRRLMLVANAARALFLACLTAVTILGGGFSQPVRVTFVHDRQSGNKLFADKVWYVKASGTLAAFLQRSAADAWAARNHGTVVPFAGSRL